MVNLLCVLFFLLLSACGGGKSGGNFLDELRDSVGRDEPETKPDICEMIRTPTTGEIVDIFDRGANLSVVYFDIHTTHVNGDFAVVIHKRCVESEGLAVGLHWPVQLFRRNSDACTTDNFILPQFQSANCIF